MTVDRILAGDVLDSLRTLPDGCVHTVVTSPPYYGLRDYGVPGQIGLEDSPDAYLARMVEVFREVRRVLRDDGTAWVNMGDSYAHNGACGGSSPDGPRKPRETDAAKQKAMNYRVPVGLKEKDLLGIPWALAFALRADGWYLRSDIIWHKPNPMPESVQDRPTKAHEYIFLLSKSARYFYDAEAVREGAIYAGKVVTLGPKSLSKGQAAGAGIEASGNGKADSVTVAAGRNRRTVWTVATAPYKEAHFATFPPKLIEPCILAGCPAKACPVCGAPWERVVGEVAVRPDTTQRSTDHYNTAERYGANNGGNDGLDRLASRMRAGIGHGTLGFSPTCDHGAEPVPGVVLDPFFGSGTTGAVACAHGRHYIGCEINLAYIAMAERRLAATQPGLEALA